MEDLKTDIRKSQIRIETDIAVMKVDLRHHIKRSDKHESWMMTIIVLLAGSVGAGLIKLIPMLKTLLT